MREQPQKPQTGKIKKRLLIFSALALGLLLLAGIVLSNYLEPAFSPPALEANAKTGIPQPQSSLNYGPVETKSNFTFALAATMYQQKDGSLLVYLTNPESSGVLLKCEIFEAGSDTVLYKSGLLLPGQYVECLTPQHRISNKAVKIEMKVYGYEPQTYYSKGTVTLTNTLQPW